MKRLIGLILVLAGVLYPFAVYWGTEHFAPGSSRCYSAACGWRAP